MGVAATLIAGLLKRFPWIAYVGLIIFVVACKLIWQGTPVMMDAADQAGLM